MLPVLEKRITIFLTIYLLTFLYFYKKNLCRETKQEVNIALVGGARRGGIALEGLNGACTCALRHAASDGPAYTK
jgi:hypothetical protein